MAGERGGIISGLIMLLCAVFALSVGAGQARADVDPVARGLAISKAAAAHTPTVIAKLRAGYLARRLNNPHVNAVMSTPPTVALTGTAPTGMTNCADVFTNSGQFYFTGGDVYNYAASAAARFPVATLTNGAATGNVGNGRNAAGWRVKVVVDSATPTFRFLQNTGGVIRFVVDGQYVSTTGTVPNAAGGNNNYIQLTFSARGYHTIWVEGDFASGIKSACVGVTEAVYAAPAGLRMDVLGDSITAATSAPALTSANDGFAQVLGDVFGVGDLRMSGSGGEGFINPASSGAGYTLIQRMAFDVTTCADAYVIAMGTNDETYTQTANQAAAQTAIQALRLQCPKAPVFVLGAPGNASGPNAVTLTTELGYFAAVTALGDPCVFVVPTSTAAKPMLFGTGKVGTTNNTGNSDIYVSSDATHPSAAGHIYDGLWWADAMFNVLNSPAANACTAAT